MRTDRMEVPLSALGLEPLLHAGVRQYLTTRYDGPQTHRHEGALEIAYLDSGYQTLAIDQREYLLRGNTVFVTQPGEWHGVGDHPFERCRLYYLVITMPTRGGRFGLAATGDGKEMVEALRALPVTFPGNPLMKELFDTLLEGAGQVGSVPLQRTRLVHAAMQLLLLVVDCARGTPVNRLSLPVQRVIQHIDAHLSEGLDVQSLASVAGLSVPRLHARFKHETGLPPAEFVQRKKIEAAKRRLRSSSRPVTTIAHDLGYSSSQYFASVFRRFTGQSPTGFRSDDRDGSDSSPQLR